MSYPRRKGTNMILITIWVPNGLLKKLDSLIPQVYPTRAEAIRDGIKKVVLDTKKLVQS